MHYAHDQRKQFLSIVGAQRPFASFIIRPLTEINIQLCNVGWLWLTELTWKRVCCECKRHCVDGGLNGVGLSDQKGIILCIY